VNDVVFTIPEILSLLGAVQSLYIIVYMLIRAGRRSRAALPTLYFLFLFCGFFMGFAHTHMGLQFAHYSIFENFIWFMGAPLSVLVIYQLAQLEEMPSLKRFWILLLCPGALLLAWLISENRDQFSAFFVTGGILSGAISLLALWSNKHIIEGTWKKKLGRERYWLVLVLIFMNSVLLMVMFLFLPDAPLSHDDASTMRTVIGLGLVYVLGTSLFRIYPQAVILKKGNALTQGSLPSAPERDIIDKIQYLIEVERVYLENGYSRKDLARECGASELLVSKVVNDVYDLSIPNLLNQHRIEDAKRLLKQTDAPVQVIMEEAGFSSLATFNRVFKDITGVSPREYRSEA